MIRYFMYCPPKLLYTLCVLPLRKTWGWIGPRGNGTLPALLYHAPVLFFYPLLLNISNLHVLHLFVFLLFVTGLCSGQSYSCRTATSLTWHLYLTCTYFISPLLFISFSSLIYQFVLSFIQFFTGYLWLHLNSPFSCVFVLLCVLLCFIALCISVNKPFYDWLITR